MRKETADKALKTHHSSHLSLYFYGAVVGVLTGIVIVGYRVSLSLAQKYREMFYEYVRHTLFDAQTIFVLAVLILVISVFLGYIVVKYPMIKGSGIPQVKGVLIRQMDFSWARELAAKFVSGVVAVGSGMSLGREGPSVQLGAEVGTGVFKIFKRNEYDKKYLISCGASAGLAAAFGAPLAGVVFAIEELHKFMSPLLVTCVLISSVCAEFVSKYFFGFSPSLNIQVDTTYQLKYYFLIIIFALLMTIIGKLFEEALLKGQKIYGKIKINPIFKPVVIITITVFMGIFFSEVTGGEHTLAEKVIYESYTYKTLIVLFVLKFLFTAACFSSGIPGGLFLPMIVLGALAGKIYGMFVINLIPDVTAGYGVYFIVLGMAALLTAVMKAPITSTILMLEVTGSFSHFFPLVTVCMITFLMTEVIKMKSINDILLENMLPKGLDENGDDEKKITIKIPVGLDSSLDGKKVKEVVWPERCLIVGIDRGDREIIPHGETKILAGDLLVFLMDERTASLVKPLLIEMGEA